MINTPEAFEHLLDQSPYARTIGMKIQLTEGQLEFYLPFAPHNIGNDQMPALHGGLIGGFMEMAAIMHMVCIQDDAKTPKTVDFSIDYLRPGFARDLYAACSVTKHGKQVANVQVTAWQESPDKPVAIARAHLLLD